MPIAGFAFTKVSAERTQGKGNEINVENNVQIKSVEEMKLGFENDTQKTLKFSFEFESKFEQGYGKISLAGEAVYVTDEKKAKEIIKEWKKDKKLNKDVMPEIMNAVLSKSNVEAILLSREVNLPSPIPLPKVNIGTQTV